MKILITGLALSRNLGAPAMALTLITELGKRFPQAKISMAVSSIDMQQELIWWKYYKNMGYRIDKIVPRSTITSYLLNRFPIKRFYQKLSGKSNLSAYKNQKDRKFWLEQHKKFLDEIRQSDLVISMYGISYVGDGVHRFTDGLSDFSPYYYARKYGIPYTRFIQSYGPFDDIKIRFFARKELNNLPFVFARGKNSAAYCRTIVDDKNSVKDMPDLAVLLPKDDGEWVDDYLKKSGLDRHGYIVVSPSAVIYNMPNRVGGSVGKKHVESMVLIVQELARRGHKILMLPHMYSDKKHDCDREICFKIFNKLDEQERLAICIVKEDVDAMQAKGLIAASTMAIVSRYHALVAAVSTSTPVVTLGWNIKYQDLMEYYCIDDTAIDVRNYEPDEIVQKVMEKIKFYKDENSMLIYKSMNDRVRKKVYSALDILADWIVDVAK